MSPRLQALREAELKRQQECTHPAESLSTYLAHVNSDGMSVSVSIECKACGAYIGGSDHLPINKKVTPFGE